MANTQEVFKEVIDTVDVDGAPMEYGYTIEHDPNEDRFYLDIFSLVTVDELNSSLNNADVQARIKEAVAQHATPNSEFWINRADQSEEAIRQSIEEDIEQKTAHGIVASIVNNTAAELTPQAASASVVFDQDAVSLGDLPPSEKLPEAIKFNVLYHPDDKSFSIELNEENYCAAVRSALERPAVKEALNEALMGVMRNDVGALEAFRDHAVETLRTPVPPADEMQERYTLQLNKTLQSAVLAQATTLHIEQTPGNNGPAAPEVKEPEIEPENPTPDPVLLDKIKGLETQYEQLRLENQTLREKLGQRDTEIEALKSENTDLEGRIQQLETENKELELQNKALSREIYRLENYDEKIEFVQGLLNVSGYDAGPIDGLYGDKTQAGLDAYAKAYGIEGTASIESVYDHFIEKVRTQEAANVFIEHVQDAVNSGEYTQVKSAQAVLKGLYFTDHEDKPLEVDGDAGSRTRAALDKFEDHYSDLDGAKRKLQEELESMPVIASGVSENFNDQAPVMVAENETTAQPILDYISGPRILELVHSADRPDMTNFLDQQSIHDRLSGEGETLDHQQNAYLFLSGNDRDVKGYTLAPENKEIAEGGIISLTNGGEIELNFLDGEGDYHQRNITDLVTDGSDLAKGVSNLPVHLSEDMQEFLGKAMAYAGQQNEDFDPQIGFLKHIGDEGDSYMILVREDTGGNLEATLVADPAFTENNLDALGFAIDQTPPAIGDVSVSLRDLDDLEIAANDTLEQQGPALKAGVKP